MKIKKAKLNEWEEIKKILKRDFKKEDINDIKMILESGDGCFVATINNKIIGTVSGHYHGKEANIEQIAVLPEYRGKGIGLKLLRYIINYFKKKGEKIVYADIDKKVFPFYKQLGFYMNHKIAIKEI